MAVEIKVPNVGESVTEGIIGSWKKPNGSYVAVNEPILDLETDKATQDIVAPAAGVLVHGAKEGDKVQIGAVVGRIEPGPAQPAANGGAAHGRKAEVTSSTTTPAPTTAPTAAVGTLSPAAAKHAADAGFDAGQMTGSGRGGRVIKEDVVAAVQERGPMLTAPVVPVEPKIPVAQAIPPVAGRETRQRMTTIRQKIAERLLFAQQNAAILTTFNEADMSAVMGLRAKYKETFQKKFGVGLGFMGFFVKAVVEALKAFPAVNARIDGQDIVFNNYYDIGVAVSTEKGLIVPVLRDADKLSFAGVEKAIAALAVKARENKISVADLQGGTFTITNGGVFGSLLSTPILNPPQSGILGMHSIQKRPVAVDDQVVIRPMMYLAFSYDHRIIDGREAVSFLVRVKECIEAPDRLLLEV
jgi:2-oxoglutarate dehydrogenase E2 component (dihydrolipoamide succinyltransferase)